MDILLAELSGRFESTNIGPLKDLSLLSSRRIREVQNNPHIVPCNAFDVTLPVTSCSVGRTFSKLKLIKTKLRTTMSQDRLESLMKISCEQDIIINNENVILLFAAKSSVLTKCLIY